jgi:hypothetical protein
VKCIQLKLLRSGPLTWPVRHQRAEYATAGSITDLAAVKHPHAHASALVLSRPSTGPQPCANDDEVWRFAAAAIRCHAHLITAAVTQCQTLCMISTGTTPGSHAPSSSATSSIRARMAAPSARTCSSPATGCPRRWHGGERNFILPNWASEPGSISSRHGGSGSPARTRPAA